MRYLLFSKQGTGECRIEKDSGGYRGAKRNNASTIGAWGALRCSAITAAISFTSIWRWSFAASILRKEVTQLAGGLFPFAFSETIDNRILGLHFHESMVAAPERFEHNVTLSRCVGWAKHSVPTSSVSAKMVGTAQAP